AKNFGAFAHPITTNVKTLVVDTSAGGGSQFITESNGLTGLQLNAGTGNVTLIVNDGSVTDSDNSVDIAANAASVTLKANDPQHPQSFGVAGKSIGTSVNNLSVDTSASLGDQFIVESNGLTGLFLNANNGVSTQGNITLLVTAGGVDDLGDASFAVD